MDEILKKDIETVHDILTRHCVNEVTAKQIGDEMDGNHRKMVGLLPGTDRVVALQAWHFKLSAFNNAIVSYNAWRRARQERASQAMKKIVQ